GNLRGKYDVIVIPHQGASAKALVYEQPKASKPLPYKHSDRFKSLGMYGETEDVRGGMGLEGAAELQKFVDQGGVLMTFGTSSFFPPEYGLTRAIDAQRPQGNFYAPGPIVQAEIVQTSHPIVYGFAQKNVPVRWADGPLLQVPDPNSPQAQLSGGIGTERATIVMRFAGGDANVLSGLMRGADQIRNRPAIVDAPIGRGRVILYAINPIYRWQNFGEYSLVFNALLFFNDMPPAFGNR